MTERRAPPTPRAVEKAISMCAPSVDISETAASSRNSREESLAVSHTAGSNRSGRLNIVTLFSFQTHRGEKQNNQEVSTGCFCPSSSSVLKPRGWIHCRHRLLFPYLGVWAVPQVSSDWSMAAACVLTPAHPPVSKPLQLATKLEPHPQLKGNFYQHESKSEHLTLLSDLCATDLVKQKNSV